MMKENKMKIGVIFAAVAAAGGVWAGVPATEIADGDVTLQGMRRGQTPCLRWSDWLPSPDGRNFTTSSLQLQLH